MHTSSHHSLFFVLVLFLSSFATTLCMSISVSKNTQFVPDVYNAENVCFTTFGGVTRLFVSGGDNVYELIRGGGDDNGKQQLQEQKQQEEQQWKKRALISQHEDPRKGTYSMGLVQYNQWLCAIDEHGKFFVGDLSQPSFQLVQVYQIANVTLANGMAANVEQGVIYVADTAPFKSSGKIVRLSVTEKNESENSPHLMMVSRQENWIASPHVKHPNGLKLFRHTILTTDGNKVVSIPVQQTDGKADVSNMRVLFQKSLTVLDDLNFYFPPNVSSSSSSSSYSSSSSSTLNVDENNSSSQLPLLVVTDYVQSSLIFLRLDTGQKLYETSKFSFAAPSSVAQGVPPLFNRDQLIVTNKGVIRVHTPWGNYISYVNVAL